MKKNILLSAVSILLFTPIFAQSPGGVSAASSNKIWLDANQLGLSNGTPVTTWTDFSGNNNNSIQNTVTYKPIFRTSQINGKPSIVFDGTNDFMRTAAISALNGVGTISFFVVFDGSLVPSIGVLLAGKYLEHNQFLMSYAHPSVIRTWVVKLPTTSKVATTPNNLLYQTLGVTWSSSTGIINSFKDGTSFGSLTGATSTPTTHNYFSIGANPGNNSSPFKGGIAEIILYSSTLNSAERKIIENYLAAKYGLATANDYYAYETTHGNDVFGIGQEADGSNATATGRTTVTLDGMSTPGNGDYVLLGDEGTSYLPANNVDVPTAGWARYGKVWRSDITGTPGTVNVTYDVSTYSIGFPDSYVLLVDGDGVFATGATPYGGTYDSLTQTVTFSAVTLADGDYMTLANSNLNIESTGVTTDWHTTSTWNCGCIPTLGNLVEVKTGHTVNISGQTASAGSLTITGTLVIAAADTLKLDKHLVTTGTFTINNGVLFFNSPSIAQTIDGNYAFNRLIVDNPNGVSINSGVSTIQGFLDVRSGSFSTNNALTMLSNAVGSGMIKNPSTGTIIGDVTVQRYLNEGDSWYLLASPLTNATIEDWNNEIEMQGFAGTEWPTAPYSSVYYYDETLTGPTQNEGYQIPVSTADILTNTKGYTIYVATDGLGSIPRAINATGAPKLGNGIVINGTYTTNIGDPTKDGWNLVGNPYQSPVKFLNVAKGGSFDVAYRKKASGASQAISGFDIVNPGEAIWLHCLGGPCTLTFDAVDVYDTVDVYNLRTTQENTQMVIKLNYDNDYDEVLLGFDENATNNYDLGLDGYKLNNSFNYKPNLAIVNRENHNQYIGMFNQDFNDVLPLKIYTPNPSGVEKNYSLSFENVSYIKERNKHLVLEDRLLNTFTPVTEGFMVDFVMNDNVSEPRFFLHVNTPLTTQKTDVTCHNQNNGKITLELDGSETVDVICYDELMNVVDARNQVYTTQNITNLQPGTYKLEVLNTGFGNVSNLISITEPLAIASAFDLTITNQIENGYTSSSTVDTFRVVQNQLLDFSNVSENTTNYTWDFGDMITSNLESPQHIYFNTGLYKVILTSKNGSCESESYKYVQVDGATSISETNLLDEVNVLVKENDIFVYMNNQNNTGNVKFEVLNQLGQKVFSTVKDVKTNHVEKINLPHASGMYFVKIDGFNYSKTKKIVLN